MKGERGAINTADVQSIGSEWDELDVRGGYSGRRMPSVTAMHMARTLERSLPR
jgi:hypothetical protein